ncbi:hypothetical protein A6R68_09103 [Neotoma lepida]|uniref:Lipoxygenase domain-containing protein n=1 Tax=Neotoma lepida TaxID=56216 RepID=A0A1A6G1R8_NEOLE|nr:hypothetical protein A6R68_09103 [Neotoma lepida]
MPSARVRDSWKDDALFGYQFLNGANPMLLRRSKSLPARLAGSLFEADFSLLDGVKPNIIIFKQQYVTAPLVMLKLEPDGSLLPMLIQLQPPRHGGPPPLLFLPSDPPMAWLLAKIWVRSSDFQLHQLQSHLLRGHLMAEVISVATMRSLPSLHPIYKVALGQHQEEYFSGPEPRAVLKQFQEELAVMDKEVEVRNAGLDLPYEYLRPSMVENSVTI